MLGFEWFSNQLPVHELAMLEYGLVFKKGFWNSQKEDEGYHELGVVKCGLVSKKKRLG